MSNSISRETNSDVPHLKPRVSAGSCLAVPAAHIHLGPHLLHRALTFKLDFLGRVQSWRPCVLGNRKLLRAFWGLNNIWRIESLG